MRRRGFTLIELLVVIAIIAILAAILFPVFAKAREKARQASCLSNTKQIALAVQIYADDYDQTFPPLEQGYGYWTYGNPSGSSWGMPMWFWMDSVLPYVKSVQIFECPSRRGQGKGTYFWGAWEMTNALGYGMNYYFNNWLYNSATEWKDFYNNMSEAQIQEPAQKIFASETTGASAGGSDPTAFASYQIGYFPSLKVPIHNGMVNYAFCDGHAKALKIAQTIAPVDMWNVRSSYPCWTYAAGWAWTQCNSEAELQAANQSLMTYIKSTTDTSGYF